MSVSLTADRLRREMARRGWDAIDLARESRLSPVTLSTALTGKPIAAKSVGLIAVAFLCAPANQLIDRLVMSDSSDRGFTPSHDAQPQGQRATRGVGPGSSASSLLEPPHAVGLLNLARSFHR